MCLLPLCVVLRHMLFMCVVAVRVLLWSEVSLDDSTISCVSLFLCLSLFIFSLTLFCSYSVIPSYFHQSLSRQRLDPVRRTVVWSVANVSKNREKKRERTAKVTEQTNQMCTSEADMNTKKSKSAKKRKRTKKGEKKKKAARDEMRQDRESHSEWD